MEKEIVLRSQNSSKDPCGGCIFLKGDDCDMPLDFDYAKYGNCGERSSCIYVYKTNKHRSFSPKGTQKAGERTKEKQAIKDAETKSWISTLESGEKTINEIAYALGSSRVTVYNRLKSYARRNNIEVTIPNRKVTTERRHLEIEELIASGMSNNDIAVRVGRGERLIRMVKTNYLKKVKDEVD